ncbi:hypothetical protein Esti_002595 [Eimeria stiedai]
MADGGEPPLQGAPPIGGPSQLPLPFHSLGGLQLQQQQQPFSQQQLLTQHHLPVHGKPASTPPGDAAGSLAAHEGPPYRRPPMMQQQLPAPFSLQGRPSLRQLQVTNARQQQQALLPTQAEQQSLHLPLKAPTTLPPNISAGFAREMQQQASAADAAAAVAAVCAAAAAPGQHAPQFYQQLDPQHRRLHQLEALHPQPLPQAPQQQQHQQQRQQQPQQQPRTMHAVQQLLQHVDMMQQPLQHRDVPTHQLYQQLSLLQQHSLQHRDYNVSYSSSSSGSRDFLEDRGAPVVPSDSADSHASRGAPSADLGAHVVRQRRASTEQAAATAVAVAAAVAACVAAGGGCCPSTEGGGAADQGGAPVSEKGEKKRKAPWRPPPSRKKTAIAAQEQQQEQQQQQQQQQQQTGQPLLKQLPLHALGVNSSAPYSQQQQLLLPQHLLQHSSTLPHWQLQQQQLLEQHLQQQQLLSVPPHTGQRAKPAGCQPLPGQCLSAPEAATPGESGKRLQQLLQLHHAAVLLQQQEIDLAVRELEVVYLPLFWGCSKREADTKSSSSGSTSSNSKSSGSSRGPLWDAPVRKLARWKGEKAGAFSAVGEGSWMLWPAERQDARCATLQRQLQLLQPCYLSEQQQMLLLEHLWCNGGDAAAAFTAAVLGPPDGRRPLTLTIMKLPPPSSFHWAAAVGTPGIPFVWRPVVLQQQEQQQQQHQDVTGAAEAEAALGSLPLERAGRRNPPTLKAASNCAADAGDLSRSPPPQLRVSVSKGLLALENRAPD